MKKQLVPILVCLLMPAAAIAADMSHEEIVVRTAYAKFAYASEQDAIVKLGVEVLGQPIAPESKGLTSDQRLAAAQVNFTLSDFVIGNVADILNKKAVDLITPAAGEALMASTPAYSFGEAGSMTVIRSIEPRWTEVNFMPPDAANITINDLYERQWHTLRAATTWQRYASYSVTVTFQGKSRGPYKALFVFGHDKTGGEVVYPEDGTTDAMALALAVKEENLFPESLLSTRLRTYSVVANWIQAKQLPGSTAGCTVGSLCCDLARLTCGPTREDVAARLSKPLPTGVPPTLSK